MRREGREGEGGRVWGRGRGYVGGGREGKGGCGGREGRRDRSFIVSITLVADSAYICPLTFPF